MVPGFPAVAQVSPDQTLAAPTLVAPGSTLGVDFVITGGTQVGNNLFHSFANFSVPLGGSAYFNNPTSVQTIIGRVTGGNRSSINGTLRVNNRASLFLINPNGIVFGPRSGLIGIGSLIATTASSLKLSNGDEFSAIAPQPPLLTISIPVGLQFGNRPAAIQLQGAPLVSPISPSNITLIGGDLNIVQQSRLLASGGQVELGSVGGYGFVRLTPISAQTFAVDYAGVPTFGNILIQQSEIRLGSGRSIQIRGNQVTVDNSSLSIASSIAVPNPGEIGVRAEQLRINNSTIRTTASTAASGFNITLEAKAGLTIQGDQSTVTAQTQGDRRGGSVQLAADRINIQGAIVVGTETTGRGAAGDTTIQTNQLRLQAGAQVSASTFSSGAGGNLTVNAADSVELIGYTTLLDSTFGSGGLFATTTARGNAGTLALNTPRLLILDGANISGSTTGLGNGGRVTVNVAQIELSGFSPGSPSSISTLTQSRGNAGILEINTGQLTLRNGGQISAGTRAEGFGGTLTINASQGITLEGSDRTGLFARSRGSGNANQLTLNTGELIVRDQAQITVSGESTGNAGNLIIRANTVKLDNQAKIVADSVSGQGGNIDLQVKDLLVLRHNSQISTSAGRARGGGDGGNINIQAKFIIGSLRENSDITANAFRGRGGNINITTNVIFGLLPQPRLTLLSDITASSQFGLNGTVTINSLNVDPSKGLEELVFTPVDPSKLVVQGCNSGRKVVEGQSRFVVLGRGGLSASPDDVFGGTPVLTDLGSPIVSSTTAVLAPTPPAVSAPAEIVEAQGWVKDAAGEIYLVNYASSPLLNETQLFPVQCQGL